VGADELFGELERAIVDHVFRIAPGYAMALGLHQYDGRLPDLRPESTDAWTAEADQLVTQLLSIPEDHLSPPRRHDRLLLQLLLESVIFDFREVGELERNPMAYIGSASLTAYTAREYAPANARTEAMVRVLQAIPAFLMAGRRRLRPVLPRPFVELALTIAGGIPSDFAEGETLAIEAGEPLLSQFREARAGAETAVAAFAQALKVEYLPQSTAEFALGPDKYRRLLWVREGLTTPAEEILRRGKADLDRNQRRLAEIAAQMDPPVSVQQLLEVLQRDHPTAEGLLPAAREDVEHAKQFVISADLATVPSNAQCRVKETPPPGRALSTASMDSPGPFEQSTDEGIYYVTLVDPAWPAEQQEQWLRNMNRNMLRNTAIHEVYPGHYLQFLHARAASSTLARKVFFSSAFCEGWAHYAEQLAIEAKYQDASTAAEATQLHDALLRNVRLVVSVGLHTQGMTLAQATEMFEKEAHLGAMPAQREAIRGTFNPEYFGYTLGKLAILEAREKYLATTFGGSRRAFHDRLLSFGAPPVGLLAGLLGGSA
jgi:uncharacterized protein (DUF885 family)